MKRHTTFIKVVSPINLHKLYIWHSVIVETTDYRPDATNVYSAEKKQKVW